MKEDYGGIEKNYDTLEKTMIPYQRLQNCDLLWRKMGIMGKKIWNYSKLQ